MPLYSWYLYRIYDLEKGEWLPGEYRASEVVKRLNVTCRKNLSDYAYRGFDIDDRYHLVDVNVETRWAPEWDETRIDILKLLSSRRVKAKRLAEGEEASPTPKTRKYEQWFRCEWDAVRAFLLEYGG